MLHKIITETEIIFNFYLIIHNLSISYKCVSLVAFAFPVVIVQFISVMILIHWIQKRLQALEPQVGIKAVNQNKNALKAEIKYFNL